MTHAAESLHWYGRDGSPRYQVTGANGKERPTTLRDARKHGYVPSVTTVIRCAAAPALERWKLDQMLHAALTLPRREGEKEEDWISRVWTDSKETARKAADRGTLIHAAVQGHFEGEVPDPDFFPHVKGAVYALKDWAGDVPWIAEKSFAHQLGFGGKCDLHEHAFGHVIDFKTKEFGPDTELKTYDEHAMQLAAYRMGLNVPDAKCAIVYVSVTNPGLVKLVEIQEDELRNGWKMFYSLLHYWQAKNGYTSSWSALEVAA